MEESLTVRYNLSRLAILVFGFALALTFSVSELGWVHWALVSIALLTGLSLGYQEARVIEIAKDGLLEAILDDDVHRILREYSPNRLIFALVRVAAIGAIVAAFMYLETIPLVGIPMFFAFQLAFQAVRFPSIVKLDRYSQCRSVRPAA